MSIWALLELHRTFHLELLGEFSKMAVLSCVKGKKILVIVNIFCLHFVFVFFQALLLHATLHLNYIAILVNRFWILAQQHMCIMQKTSINKHNIVVLKSMSHTSALCISYSYNTQMQNIFFVFLNIWWTFGQLWSLLQKHLWQLQHFLSTCLLRFFFSLQS